MNLSTDAQLQRYGSHPQGSLRACGGYFPSDIPPSRLDTVYGEYTPWSTGESGGDGDKLNQSSASLGLDDMVSRIIDDDQGFNTQKRPSSLFYSEEHPWQPRDNNDPNLDPSVMGEHSDYNSFNLIDNVFQSNNGLRGEGRKLVGRQEKINSQSPNNLWYTSKPDANQCWLSDAEPRSGDIWNERAADLFVDTGQQWSSPVSKDYIEMRLRRGDQLLQSGGGDTASMSAIGARPDSSDNGSAGHTMPAHDPGLQQRLINQQRAAAASAGYQNKRPTAIPLPSSRGAMQQRYSPVSPVQPPIGSPGQSGRGNGGQASLLQRQALHQQQQLKYGGGGGGMVLPDRRYEQCSPLPSAYTHLSRSPISDATSSMGSPTSRAPDSPMYGHQPNSPLLHSPQTGGVPIAHHHMQQHFTYNPEYLSPTGGAFNPEPYIGQMVPRFFYGPGGELLYEMVTVSPQQFGRLHQQQQQQHYQHRPPRRTGPANELHIKLEDSYEQFKSIEKERKKFEGEMARQNPGQKISSTNNAILPRLPTNPSRVDRLIVDSLKEHSKVITLLVKMEGLNGKIFHANIHTCMDGWLDSIRKVQTRRKEEIINATNRHRSGAPRNHDERDVVALAAAIAELSQTCRRARTALWCALQISWKSGYIPLGVISKRAEIAAREKEALKEQQQLISAQSMAANGSASTSSSVSSVAVGLSPGVRANSSLSSCSISSSLYSASSLSGTSMLEGFPLWTGALDTVSTTTPLQPYASIQSVGHRVLISPSADGNNNLLSMPKDK